MHDDDELEDEIEDEAWDRPPEPGTFDIGLEGRLWNVDRFHALDTVLPEKMELIDGKLFGTERWRLGMLGAMLEQVGLVETVKLAPKALWLEALKRVRLSAPGMPGALS